MKPLKALLSARSHFWSLADQALVSGCNFLIGIALARFLGLESFGAYVIAQMYLLYANTFQASLVVSPMMTAVPTEHDPVEQARLIRGFMGYALLVMLVTLVGTQVLAAVLGALSEGIGIGGLALPLAGAMAAFQMQDWLRRALYATSSNRLIFVSDLIAYGSQLAGLVWLGISGSLDAYSAFMLMAGTFTASALFAMGATRYRPDPEAALELIRRHAHASRDFFATWQLQWLGSQGVILLGSAVLGPHVAGAIRAAQNLLGPVNVMFQWLDNVLPVRAARRYRDHGDGALVAYLGSIAVLGLGVLGVFVLGIALVDEPLMTLLYGEEFRPYAFLVVLVALYYFFGFGYRIASYLFRTLGRTRYLAKASLWWLVASFGVVLTTLQWLEDRAILWGLVMGQCIALLYLLAQRRAVLPGGAAASGAAPVHRHILIRRPDGSPRLVLPCTSTSSLHEALSMYYPSRWLGRAYRALQAHTLPWRIRLGWVEAVHSLATLCPGIQRVVEAVPGADARYLGALIGAPGPCSKWTVKLMAADGGALAYSRVARQPLAVARLRGELAILAALDAAPVAHQVPRILAHGEIADGPAFYLVESAGPEHPSSHALSVAHFDFLAGLARRDTAQPWSAVLDQLALDCGPLHAIPSFDAVLGPALQFLRGAARGTVPVCFEHGDFAPWNIRDDGAGRLFVLDWEHARQDGVPWLDALHFCYQVSALVERESPDGLLKVLRHVFELPVAQGYARAMAVPAECHDVLVMVYLLRGLVSAHCEGHAPADAEQSTRVAVLMRLLQVRRQ
ncbi:MAG: phosphotransferase [Rhodocyclaceae bacterium]|nr:phosphotransferase [Rhodocyclaceae bacterium]